MRPARVDLVEKQPDTDLYKANNDFIVEKEAWQEKVPAKPKVKDVRNFPKAHACQTDHGAGKGQQSLDSRVQSPIMLISQSCMQKQVTQILLAIMMWLQKLAIPFLGHSILVISDSPNI